MGADEPNLCVKMSHFLEKCRCSQPFEREETRASQLLFPHQKALQLRRLLKLLKSCRENSSNVWPCFPLDLGKGLDLQLRNEWIGIVVDRVAGWGLNY